MLTTLTSITDAQSTEGNGLDALPGYFEGLMGHRRFRAMNTDIQVFTKDSCRSDMLRRAERIFHDLESRLSRFLADSELSVLNSQSGAEVAVSPELLRVLEIAREFCHTTGGVFDPAVLPYLEAAGYDRSFELIPAHSPDCMPGPIPRAVGSIAEVRLDSRRRTVRAPRGVRLDLGGVGKGYAVDKAAAGMAEVNDFLIDAGGDIFASGSGPDDRGWLVSVANPLDDEEDIALLRLHNQALATSTVAVRYWMKGGRTFNHLIDKRTGRPIDNDIVSVSVVAPSAVAADVLAKTAVMLGYDEGSSMLESQRVEGLFVFADYSRHYTAGWRGEEPVTPVGE